jgi:hypothetical protein
MVYTSSGNFWSKSAHTTAEEAWIGQVITVVTKRIEM